MPFADDAVAAEHAAAYDAWADTFAERTAQMPPELAALGSRILDRFPSPPRILDVGCGPGRDMAWFEERGATVVGIDVSPRMLELARRRCAGELLEMDMRQLALPDAAFDVVWSIASLLHLPKADASGALEEFRRVAQPDGVVVVAVKRGTGERWEQPGDAPRRLFPGTRRMSSGHAWRRPDSRARRWRPPRASGVRSGYSPSPPTASGSCAGAASRRSGARAPAGSRPAAALAASPGRSRRAVTRLASASPPAARLPPG